MTIPHISRKSVKERLWKALNIVVGLTTIFNVSMIGTVFVPTAHATGPTWPTDSQWVVPVCNDDPANDENPSSSDLKASGSSEYAAAYFIDGNNLYLRERVDGNPGTPGNLNEFAWVFMVQKNAASTDYDFLVSLRGSGNGENVELWQNTTPNGPIDFSPLFNDPAETQLNTWSTTTNSRVSTVGSDYFVDWQIPVSELTSRGVTVTNGRITNSGLYWATSTNANNYNKDHLNCYESPDVRITKEVSKNGGSYFTDGRTSSITAAPGDTLKYRVTLTNVGGPQDSATTVTDELGKNYNDGDGDASHNVDPSTQYSDWTTTKNFNSDGNGYAFTGSWGNGSADSQSNDTLTATIAKISGGGASESFTFDSVVKNLATGSYLLENVATSGQVSAETDVPVVSTPTRTPNPPLGQSCGLDIGLVVDTSGSVDSTEMSQMKTALSSFASAFTGTPTVFSLSSFNTNSTLNRAFSRTPAQIANDITTDTPASGNNNTNWDSGLARGFSSFDPRPAKANLIVIATDGSPNRWGYTTADPTFDWDLGLANAIDRANAIKTAGTRIVVVGIGEDTGDPATPAQKLEKMKSISGDVVALTPGAITTNTDVIKVTDFSGIGTAMAAYANQLCGGKILVQKQFDTNGDGTADLTGNVADPLLGGWEFDVNGAPSNPATQTTTNTGALEFDVLNGTYSIVESGLKANTKLVSASCVNGNQTVGTVDLATRTISGLTMGTDDTVSCTFVNGYQTGSLKVTKVVQGGTATPDQFGFRIGNAGGYTNPASGQDFVVFNNLNQGSYSINETGPADYHQVSTTCNNVSVTPGQQATCTITNARNQGQVTFDKVVPGFPQSESLFHFHVNGNGNYTDGSVAAFDTGTYIVTEDVVADYSFVSASGICSVNQQGQIVMSVTTNGGTCTITNSRDTGSVQVTKLADTDGNGSFETLNPATFNWSLDGNGTNAMGATVSNVITGLHDVNENSVANYHFIGWYPTSSTQYSCANPAGVTLPVSVNVTKGNTTAITLCNARDTGNLTIHKLVDTDGDGDVDQTDPQGWTFDIQSGEQNIAMGSTRTLVTGNYTVSEDQHVNYHSTGWICYSNNITVGQGVGESLSVNLSTSGANCWFTNTRDTGKVTILKQVVGGAAIPADWDFTINGTAGYKSGNEVTMPTGDYPISEAGPANYTLTSTNGVCEMTQSGVVLHVTTLGGTCTFVNTRDTGTIKINKYFDDNGDGQIDRTNPEGWTWDIVSGSQDNIGGATVIVNTGSYTVTEDAATNYSAAWSCNNDKSGYGTSISNIGVSKDQNVVCAFTNTRDTGTIKINKYFDDNGDGQIDRTNPEGWTWDIVNGGQNNAGGSTVQLVTGPYTATEDVITDYHTNWYCSDQSFGLGTQIQFGVAKNQNLTCNFYNVRDTGNLTIHKLVDTDGDGDVDQTDPQGWTFDIQSGEQNIAMGSTRTLVTGNYTVSEDQHANYHVSDWACYNGNQLIGNGTGESLTVSVSTDGAQCWFTNTRDTGTVTIVKEVIGGTALPIDWEFTVNGTDGYYTGDSVTLPTGDYAASETGPDGYTLTSVSGVCELTREGVVLHITTQGGTCTFTNTRDMGTIVVNKMVDTNGDGTFEGDNEVANELGFRWNLDGGAYDRLMGSDSSVTTLDTHMVSENSITDYHFVGWFYSNEEVSCSNAKLMTSLPAQLSVKKNGATNITLCNARDTGVIKVVKNVDTDGDGDVDVVDSDDWTWNIDNGGQHYTTGTSQTVVTGTYTLSEDNKDGFHSLGWTCSNENHGTGTSTGEQLVTTDGLTCTFTNQKNVTTVNLDKQAPADVEAGDTVTYTLAWEVGGNTAGTDVVISDVLPSNTSFISADNNGSYDNGTNTVSWNLGTKNPGDKGTVTLVVASATPLPDGTSIENTGCIEANEVSEPNCDTTTTKVHSDLTVTLDKIDDVDPVIAGNNVTYTLSWSVSGNAPVDTLVITDPLPANTSFVSASNGGSYDNGSNIVTWNLGSQLQGSNGSVTLTVKVASPLVNGTVLTNVGTACVDSNTRTEAEVLHRCDDGDETTTVSSAPLLSITKTSNVVTFVNPGTVVEYTVTVTNAASATDTARNVIITDTLPAGFTFAVDGTTTKSFPVGDLVPGQSASVTYLVNISGTQAAGTYNNIAKAKGDNTIEVTATTPIEVRVPQVLGSSTSPDLTITKVVSKNTAKPGDVVTYTITVKNVGDGDAENVIITDTLPKDLSFVHNTGRTVTWSIGKLAAGHTRVLNVDVRVESDAKTGKYENVATVHSDEVSEKQATATLTVKRPKVLGLATTGTGLLDYTIGLLGLALIVLGALGLRRKPEEGKA